MKRKICVITGTRAEYGILHSLIEKIAEDDALELQIIATGSHLTGEYGNTYKNIIADGFKIDKTIDILLSSGTKTGVLKSMGLALIGFSEALSELKPDMVVILGDRFEIIAAAQACMVLQIPISHLHGGERTEGAIDEPIRHAVTKMSHLHFTSTDEYRKRVIQLGESPERVFSVGALGLDNINKLDLLSFEDFKRSIGKEINDKYFLVTYHPVTMEKSSQTKAVDDLLTALSNFSEYSVVITMPNADPDSKEIAEAFKHYEKHNANVHCFTSLGQLRYLSAVKHAAAVIGNSSSAIIEAPYLKTPTVNIGNRQGGRIAGPSIIQCTADKNSISDAIKKAISSDFIALTNNSKSLYGDGKTAKRILQTIKTIDLENIIIKKFYDIDFKL